VVPRVILVSYNLFCRGLFLSREAPETDDDFEKNTRRN